VNAKHSNYWRFVQPIIGRRDGAHER